MSKLAVFENGLHFDCSAPAASKNLFATTTCVLGNSTCHIGIPPSYTFITSDDQLYQIPDVSSKVQTTSGRKYCKDRFFTVHSAHGKTPSDPPQGNQRTVSPPHPPLPGGHIAMVAAFLHLYPVLFGIHGRICPTAWYLQGNSAWSGQNRTLPPYVLLWRTRSGTRGILMQGSGHTLYDFPSTPPEEPWQGEDGTTTGRDG